MDRIEYLFQEWHRLGGAVLLATVDPAIRARRPEVVLAESTAHCRASGRLTWVVLDWLIRNADQVDADALIRETRVRGDLAVLGVLCDAARQRKPSPTFERILAACAPRRDVEPFFYRVAQSPLALQETRAHALEIFQRWGFLCSELRYLGAP